MNEIQMISQRGGEIDQQKEGCVQEVHTAYRAWGNTRTGGPLWAVGRGMGGRLRRPLHARPLRPYQRSRGAGLAGDAAQGKPHGLLTEMWQD